MAELSGAAANGLNVSGACVSYTPGPGLAVRISRTHDKTSATRAGDETTRQRAEEIARRRTPPLGCRAGVLAGAGEATEERDVGRRRRSGPSAPRGSGHGRMRACRQGRAGQGMAAAETRRLVLDFMGVHHQRGDRSAARATRCRVLSSSTCCGCSWHA